MDTVSSRAGVGFRFNAVDQHRHPVNRTATLLLLATSELCAREVSLLYGPVLVASHDDLDAPAGLSREQWRMLGGGPKVTWSDKWTLSCRVARDARQRRRVWGPKTPIVSGPYSIGRPATSVSRATRQHWRPPEQHVAH
jgi:hypothetical protein